MSVKPENEPATSTRRRRRDVSSTILLSRRRAGKPAWTRLMGGRSHSRVENSTVQSRSEQLSTPVPEHPDDHKAPERRLPFKALYDWERANTLRSTWLPRWLRHPVSGALAAILLQVAAIMVTLLLVHIFPTFTFPGLLELFVIALVAFIWGTITGIVATLAGAVLLNFAILPPQFGWSFTHPGDIVAEILFVLIGLFISVFASWIEQAHHNAEEHDISELRQSEFTATRRARELEAIFENMADAVFVFGNDGQVLRLNAAAREIFALDARTDLSQPFHERRYSTVVLDEHDQPLPEDEWPLFRVVGGEALTSANALDMKVRTANGHELELSVSGAPMLDSKGQIIGAVCICRDVTERRILERRTHDALNALLRMAEALVLVPDNTKSTTGELDAINRIPTFMGSSRVAQRLVELTRSVLGCKRVAITSMEPETNELHAIAVVGISPEQEREWRERRRDFSLGSMFIDSAYSSRLLANEVLMIDMTQPPFHDLPNPYDIHVMLLAPMSVGNQLVGLLSVDYGHDEHEYTEEEIALAGAVAKLGALVLERERLLRERAEARGNEIALRAANQQMEEFLGMISHELKTPLTSIKGNTQLTVRQLKNSLQAFEKMLVLQESAEQQSKRLNRMVDDLLDVSRTQAGHLELHPVSCDLVAIVEESIAEQRTGWPGRTITLDVADRATMPIFADADRIGQVITNYLTNALKYSDEDQPVQVRLLLEGEEARVAVQDEGPGLSLEDQQHIWERFQRIPGIEMLSTPRSSTAGLGLGLYISKTIIEGHGGAIGVESAPGEGSTFWFTLPLARQDNE